MKMRLLFVLICLSALLTACAKSPQAAPLRAAVYQAFCDGVIPLDGTSEARFVRVRLTGDAIQPFVFVQCRNAFAD